MKKRYDEVMDRIEVTDEMRGRILDNIRSMDIETASKGKIVQFSSIRRYLTAAACFAVLLAGAVTLPRLMNREPPEPPLIQAVPQIEEVSSRRELSGLVGFEVAEEFALPFTAENISYVSYWNELAEVNYAGGEQSATFRKSIGTSDNSGDYTPYSDTAEISVDGWTVTLRGEGGNYALAIWTEGEFSCSLRLSRAIPREDWQTVFGT